jgi:hypothetical protein
MVEEQQGAWRLPPEVQGFVGVYNADGGLRGEVTYVIGHLLRRTECALCDITHSPIRRKRSWDRAVAGLDRPFSLLHRDEVTPSIAAALGDRLPGVLVLRTGAEPAVLLGPDELRGANGDVESFFTLLMARLRTVS